MSKKQISAIASTECFPLGTTVFDTRNNCELTKVEFSLDPKYPCRWKDQGGSATPLSDKAIRLNPANYTNLTLPLK